MKPVLLTMSAFGPYADREIIDFRKLQERDFFLIHGKTGGGKTTILDAVTFALYGESSGKDRLVSQLKSQHADPSAVTEVEFIFRFSGAVYKLYRSPGQERAKKRGEGMTYQNPKAVLWLLDDNLQEVKVLKKGDTKVTRHIEKLLQFRADQFRQVVILPQGKFQQVLTAEPAERESLFRTLFGTEFYSKVTDKLKQKSLELKNKRIELIKISEGILQNQGVENVEELESNLLQQNQNIEQLLIQVKNLESVKTRMQEKTAKAEKDLELILAHKKASEELETVKNKTGDYEENKKNLKKTKNAKSVDVVYKNFINLKKETDEANGELRVKQKRLKELKRSLALKEQEKPLQEQRIKRLEAARRAERIVAGEEAYKSAKKTFDEEQKKKDTYQKKLNDTEKQLQKATEEFEAEEKKTDQRKDAEKEVTRIKTLQAKAALIAEMKKKRQELEKNAESLYIQKKNKEKSMQQVEAQILKGTEKREALIPLISGLKGVQAEKKEAAELLQSYKILSERKKSLSVLEKKRTEAAQAYQEALLVTQSSEKTLWTLQHKYHSAQAAKLASNLIPGEPCPVCGSPEHPHPAEPEKDQPTKKQISRAEAELKKSRKIEKEKLEIKTAVDSEYDVLKGRIESLKESLGEYADTPVAPLVERMKSAEDDLKKIHRSQKELDKLEYILKKGRDSLEKQKAELTELSKKTEEITLELAERKGELEGAEREVPEELREPGKLSLLLSEKERRRDELIRRHEKARKEKESLESKLSTWKSHLTDISSRINEAGLQAAETKRQFDDLLQKEGFEDADEYIKSRLKSGEMKKIESLIEEYKTKVDELNTRLKSQFSLIEESHTRLNRLKDKLETAKSNFEQKLSSEGFKSEEAFLGARISDEEIESLEAIINDFERRLAIAVSREREAAGKTEGLSMPDMEQLKSEQKKVEAEYAESNDNLIKTRTQRDQMEKTLKNLKDNRQKLQEVDKKYGIVGELAETAAGQGPGLKLNLQRFVLSVLLEEVLDSAGERLERMSRGRYRLEPYMGTETGKRLAGLGIHVFDHFTGESREAKTLSGGETFLASLSLALGLVDVVQAHAGGVSLDTIFIDEGFGSLDGESLDIALDTIDQLKQPGRLVGIISHVEALRTRIPTRLEILAGKTGSRTRFVLN